MATLTSAKRGAVARFLAASAIAAIAVFGFVFGEALLAGPIIFLVELLGFWLGYVAFCLIWAGIGIIVLTLWNLFFAKRQSAKKTAKGKPSNWRERLVLWFSGFARSFGTLAAVVFLGPVFAWTIFKLLGYRERSVYVLTLISTWIFGGVWVTFYSIGVWDFGLSRLF
jgi:hypothetical protein